MRERLAEFGIFLKGISHQSYFLLMVGVLASVNLANIDEITMPDASQVFQVMILVVIYTVLLILAAGVLKPIMNWIGDIFVAMGNYEWPQKKANIDFPVPLAGTKISLEIKNTDAKLDLEYISVYLDDVEQLQDRFGNLPFDEDEFSRQYSELGHSPKDKWKLERESGGSVMSNEIFVPPTQSVYFHLFEIEFSSMSVPKLKQSLRSFSKARYEFTLILRAQMDNRSVPEYLFVVVENTGDKILIEKITSSYTKYS